MRVNEQFCDELAQAVIECVHQGRFAHSVLQKKLFTNKHWSLAHRSAFAESFYSVIRNWRRIQYALTIRNSDHYHEVYRMCIALLESSGITVHQHARTRGTYDKTEYERRWRDAEVQRTLKYSLPD